MEVGKGEGEEREMEEERRGKGEGRGEEGGPKMQEPQATGAHGASRENSPAGPGDGDGFTESRDLGENSWLCGINPALLPDHRDPEHSRPGLPAL